MHWFLPVKLIKCRCVSLIVGTMRDRASANNFAMRTISVTFNCLMDMPCFCTRLTMLDSTPILEDFMKY